MLHAVLFNLPTVLTASSAECQH